MNLNIPLQELIAALNANGYVLTIEQILEIQTLLLSSPVTKLSTKELKFLITPVIARNGMEQGEIYGIIDAWVAEKTFRAIPKENPVKKFIRKYAVVLMIAGIMAVLSTAVLVYFDTGAKAKKTPVTKKIPAKKETVVKKSEPAPTLTLQQNPSPVSIPKEFDFTISATTELEDPIQRAIIDNRLPLSLVFGFILGAVLFHFISYEQRKKMELEKRKRTEDAVFTIPERGNGPDEALHPFNELETLQQMDLRFANRDYLIHRPGLLQKIKNILLRPAFVENPPIDIRASIRKTITGAGMATIVSESEWRDRKYIFICDKTTPDAHITNLLEYVVKHLKAGNPNILRYYYADDVLQLKDISGRATSLAQLAHAYPQHHVIITGTCQAFCNAETLRLKEEVVDIFSQWPSRHVITPVPFADWSVNEWQLQNKGFTVVPAEMENIELMARSINGQASIKIRESYSIAKYDLRYIDQLQTYLQDDELFRGICGIAVYPFLRWPITLAVFDKLGIALTYDRLLKLCRIPWMNAGIIDPPIRLQLLDALDLPTEMEARETILKLLDEVKPLTQPGTAAYAQLQVQYNINSFFLYSRDQYKYKQYAGVKEVIGYYWNNLQEWELKEHVERQQGGLVPGKPVKASSAVEAFVVQEKQYEKLTFRIKQVAVLTIPAATIYMLFALIKPRIAYMEDELQKISMTVILEREGRCKHEPLLLSMSSGILAATSFTDTVQLADIPFESDVEVKLHTAGGAVHNISIPATHALCRVAVNCR